MALTVQVPTVGQSNSTEAVKVTNSLTNLSTWANGNVQDTDLNSPNNGVRRLLLEDRMAFGGGQVAGFYFADASGGGAVNGGVHQTAVKLWIPDQGLSSQPTDFQVANKASFCRIRVSLCVNTVSPGITFTMGLYPLSTLGGVGVSQIIYTFGGVLAGSTVASASPAATTAVMLETGQFAMPTSGNPYAIGFQTSGTMPANCTVAISAQLYGYNA